jgi:diguanylate cyclase (GGDEF)-like protein
MTDRRPDILILCRDPRLRQQCTTALTDVSARLWQGTSQLPGNGPVDVLVTDGPVDRETLGDDRLGRRLARGDIAIVSIDESAAADVCLPPDFTVRELRLACTLLAQLACVRRERRRAGRLNQLLHRLAMRDPLTGLPNRRAWNEQLLARRTSKEPAKRQLCLAMIDLDHFKQVNQRFGHRGGDDVLRHVGRELTHCIREDDFAARLGGDEFGVLTSAAGDHPATMVDSLRVKICQNTPLTATTASAGFALASSGLEHDTEQLFRQADQALRQAKASGRDRTTAWAWPDANVLGRPKRSNGH